MADNKKLILVTNDDGYLAKGINCLVDMLRPLGRVVVVAPVGARSGKSHAVSLGVPLTIKQLEKTDDYELHACSGTPADCVKIAMHSVLDRLPDILVSGINHGSNAAVNALYSGTVGASTEAAFHGIPAVALSLTDHDLEADFTAAIFWAEKIVKHVLQTEMPKFVSLNVNVPNIAIDEIKGIRTCRMTHGRWVEEFREKQNEKGEKEYWLIGTFINFEANSEDTDEWALANNYVSVVPIDNDLTAYSALKQYGALESL